MKPDFNQSLVSVQGEMYRYALQLTADEERASDLVQDTSLRALINADKFVADTNFKGWIATMMKNLYINEYRREQRTPVAYRINEGVPMDRLGATDFQCGYDESLIRVAIQNLSKERREVISMVVEGYSYEEIAEATSSKMGTIKSRIFNARAELRKALEFM